MPVQFFRNIKEAIGNLDPEEARRHAERPIRLFLYADHDRDYRQMETFFAPPELSAAKRASLNRVIIRASEGFLPAERSDLEIYFEDSPHAVLTASSQVFPFRPDDRAGTIREVLAHRPDLAIPLAVHIHPF